MGLLRAQAASCGRGVPEHQSWKHAPSAYVVCTKDRATDTELQQDMAARCDSVREWQTGHSPFVGRPELVIDLVLELLDVFVVAAPVCDGDLRQCVYGHAASSSQSSIFVPW
ncbi:alpha/beta fold hydrolase [Streptomyces sp. NPDC059970]|uniref:alpha/beta fold hydrolase n=1 Tax=Streptomyces sp. NPDC059970 TaxID=3347019 RepID=UPI003680CFB0